MGEARRRGTREQRVQQAKERLFKEHAGVSINEIDNLNDRFDVLEIQRRFKANVVDTTFFKEMNALAYDFFQVIKVRALFVVNNTILIEKPSRALPSHLWLLGEGAIGARCFVYEGAYHIGISVETALETFNMFLFMASCKQFLRDLVPDGEEYSQASTYVRHRMTPDWHIKFPSRMPRTAVRVTMAQELAMDVISVMILHELVHLWHGHNELVRLDISDEQKKALEFQADTVAILLYINQYRMAIPTFKEDVAHLKKNDDYVGIAVYAKFYLPPERRLSCIFFACFCFLLNMRQEASATHLSSHRRAINFVAVVLFVFEQLGHFPEWGFDLEKYAGLIKGTLKTAEECWSYMVGNSNLDNLITSHLDDSSIPEEAGRLMTIADELLERARQLEISAFRFDSDGNKI